MTRKRKRAANSAVKEEMKTNETVATVDEKEKKPISGVLFEQLTVVFRFFLFAIVAVLSVLFMAVGVIPAMGEMLLAMSGFTENTTMASILAIWLVPDAFVTFVLGYAIVKFLSWFWRILGVGADKLIAKQAMRRK